MVRERTIRDLPGGFVEIDYEISDPGEFVRWALKWGAEAEILGPPDVRAAAAALAREIAARYDPEAKRLRSNSKDAAPEIALRRRATCRSSRRWDARREAVYLVVAIRRCTFGVLHC